MRSYFLFFILLTLTVLHSNAQPVCYFEHYSTEDGLPQYTIMDIVQDQKGFMWFATWDGFSKFDGYSFKNYKVRSGDDYYMKSNRIEHMYEDKYGNIWLHSYDDQAHCFDPDLERFKGIQSVPGYEDYFFELSEIKITESGEVWLLSESNGCMHVADSVFSIEVYNQEKGNLKGNKVCDIFEDQSGNVWILTDNGLSLKKKDHNDLVPYFSENKNGKVFQAFFSAIELPQEIWFGSNNGRIWKYNKQNEKFNLLELPVSSNIKSFHRINEEELVITTSNDGFLICNIYEDKVTLYNKENTKNLKSNRINTVYFDKLKQLWFETEELGIYKFDSKSRKLNFYFVKTEDYSMSSFPAVAKVIEDIYGQIWVHPRGGGFSFYDKESDKLEPFYNIESSPDWKFSNILHSVYSDRQGNLWFCSRSHGLEKITFENNHFRTLQINPDNRLISSNDVRAVLQDSDNQIWIATKDRKVTVFDQNFNRLGNFSAEGKIVQNSFFTGQVYSMIQDDDGNIWMGTKSDGLFKIRKTFQAGHYHLEHFKKDEKNIYSISDDVVYSIFQDSKKNIWIGTYGNGLNLVQTTPEGKTVFINHRNVLKNYPIQMGYRIRFIEENKFGNLCIGTTGGLIMFSSGFSSPDDIDYKAFIRIPGDKESLGSNDVHGICNTERGDMFLATFGGGVNKVAEYDEKGFPIKFRAYTKQDGLPSDVCLAIIEDENNNLWISMENNLSKFDPMAEEFKVFAEVKRIMSTYNFSEASSFRLKNGDLVFGYSNGIINFSPQTIINNNYSPYIALSGFRLFNREVQIGVENSPLETHIDDVKKLRLTKKQNFFSIEYAALDFTLPENILYAYKLEGFDNDWIYSQKQRVANYTNIPKGEYIFRVKSTNSDGVWVDNERSLPITVLPSFWETSFAYVIYSLLFIAMMYLVFRILLIFYKLKNNVEIEKQLSEIKLRFFTDISHEIRTPLTMISAPIDYLITDNETPEKIKKQLTLVSQNTNRLLRLVNQIMDFRKVQQFRLKVQETDLGHFVEDICRNFEEIAQKNKIDYKFINEAKGEKVWVDQDCLEKILLNLLSNAFKYTPNGKAIQISVKQNDKQLIVEVKDEGKGISKERQRNLFTRFASFNEDKSKPSTGIGLFIVKDLVDKHGGKITYESESGQGSCFTVIFQRGISHFDKNVEVIPTIIGGEEEKKIVEEMVDDNYLVLDERKKGKKSILIVEDDTDLRTFIKTILEKEYLIIEAEDGVEGLDKAEKESPDFIVSDIMMPRMDGIELLQNLKENINTSHIPVILLTAKTTIETKLEGLTYGADDYITKPFSVPYFKARINNLLEQRKRLQEIYRKQLNSSSRMEFEPQPFIITSQDEVLMKKVVELIEEHMDNGDFTVEDLSLAIGMSRSVFFNKVKSLTGLAPLEFIRDIKMKRAAQLLSTGQYMVKEVSFMIGISDTKYFGKGFKAKYGMTPQEYKNQFNQDSNPE